MFALSNFVVLSAETLETVTAEIMKNVVIVSDDGLDCQAQSVTVKAVR